MLTAQHWRADLQFLVDRLLTAQESHFYSFRTETIKSAAMALNDCIPTLLEHQIIVKISELLATVGSGLFHLGLPFNPTIAFQRFPITLAAFPDGVYVTSTTILYQDLMCSRLLKIGGVSIENVVEAAGSICPAENAIRMTNEVLSHVVIPEVLQTLGIIDTTVKAEFLVETQLGDQQTIEAEAIPFEFQHWTDDSPIETTVVSLNHSQVDYLFTLPNSEIGVMSAKLPSQERPTMAVHELHQRLEIRRHHPE